MKTIYKFTLSLAMFGGVAGLAAQSGGDDKAAGYMRRLAASMESMQAYTVDFRASAGDESISGRYAVNADRYHIIVAGNEVYGDDHVRREVDSSKREIVIDAADTTSRNLLTNPTRGFRFLGDDYRPHLDSESDGRAVVTLTPVQKGVTGTITVTMSTADSRPRQIQYDTEGERVTIVIERIAKGAVIPQFDSALYPDYEIIDFR